VKVARIETIALREPTPERWDRWCTTPMDVFLPDSDHRPPKPGAGVSNVLVHVQTDDGLDGYGLVGLGSPAAIPVIEHHLAPQVVGRSPFDVELIWERMFRSTVNIGRKGLVLEAVSAIDIALWDVLGQAQGQPVYNLIGGRTKPRLRAYVSSAYAREDLDRLGEEVRRHVGLGYTALKMRFGYGPNDGEAGKRRNERLVATVREAAGEDVEVAADAYMGWDAGYAVDMIRRLEPYRLAWVEEPVLPDDYEGYRRIRDAVSTPISGGEHEFTRWGYFELLKRGCVDIVQPDVNRMGGITEALKVWSIASGFGIPVYPHSNAAHNAHLILSHLNSPLIEVFPEDEVRTGYTLYQHLFDGQPVARDGYVEVSDAPGFGLTLNRDVLDELRVADPFVR
jgi:L-rhamnonate dehydratase